ncbi:MAG: hypothetical protein JWN73_2790 [Betaproteobacteria bacterium]|nr:hypothetical protein [Betaproteobacteria bacterium]
MNISRRPRMLLAGLILLTGLYAGEAAARTHAAPSASRYAHWVADHQRYPIGSPDFYHQFAEAESRNDVPATVVAGMSGGLIDGVGGSSQMNMTMQEGEASSSLGVAAGEDAFVPRGSMAGERHEAPASGLILPMTALGLMLFVACRRASLQ